MYTKLRKSMASFIVPTIHDLAMKNVSYKIRIPMLLENLSFNSHFSNIININNYSEVVKDSLKTITKNWDSLTLPLNTLSPEEINMLHINTIIKLSNIKNISDIL